MAEQTEMLAVRDFRNEIIRLRNSVRILVVEDDPLIREFVVEALREEGFDVIHAADGEHALAWYGRQAADVLVTDVKLPGKVDGWQIASDAESTTPTSR
jgi:DNA-binding response OmpR family regulator